ncbi:MAG: KAP family NTPase [Clostridiales Family XIII bacterium]|jgi:hypothetical protein|nr:KAP family NTPase [Clostridiales Family XIII bacterium]
MGNFLYSHLTFERDDVFNRKPFVESIMKLISEWGGEIFNERGALSVSVDSPWGTGKSSLIGMWANYIAEVPKYSRYKAIYYNAWRNNYFDDAFRPLAYELQSSDDGPHMEAFRKSSVELAKVLEEGSNGVLRALSRSNSTEGSGYFEGFRRISQVSEVFGKALAKLAPPNGKLLVFVDELDRCRPNFAVETLELIRHYLNSPDLVFIFTLDLAQFTHLVKTIYGYDTDAWGYLRRFFNISFRMPMPQIGKYVDNLLYKSIRDCDGLKEVKFSKHMADMYSFFGLPIRDIEKITTNFIVFYSMNRITRNPEKPGSMIRLLVYLYFMIIKYKYPDVCEGIMGRGGYHIEGDLVEGKYVLGRRYCGLGEVKDLLRTLQGSRMWDEDAGPGYIAEYLIPEIAPEARSIGQHISEAIELFAEVG